MYGVNGSRMRNDEFFDYDKMGNITSLLRLEESGSVNDLDIHYRGNQLLKVTDGNHSFPATYDFLFILILLTTNKNIIMIVMGTR